MRSRLRKTAYRVFRVELTVHRLESIPVIHRLFYIHWRARRAVPSDGRTPSKPAEKGNVVNWETTITFTISVPPDSSDPTVLQPCPLTLQLRSERRTRWVGLSHSDEGSFNVDLSEVAAVGFLHRSDIFNGSLLNMILRTSIRVTHLSGDKIFRTRTLPSIAPPSIAPPSVAPPSLHNTSTPSTPGLDPSASSANPLASSLIDPAESVDLDIPAASADPITAPRLAASTALPRLASASFSASSGDVEPPFFQPENTPRSVLFNSIPNPEIAQRAVYDHIFQERIRDEWPDYVVQSRVDAVSVVDQVYASICAADGIGVPPGVRRDPPAQFLGRRSESVPQAGPVAQMLLTRNPSVPSPRLQPRSSSMDDIRATSSYAA